MPLSLTGRASDFGSECGCSIQPGVTKPITIKMDRREELVELAGQVINGIMSADDSVISKILDRSIHSQVAATAVSIASDIQKEIDKHYD